MRPDLVLDEDDKRKRFRKLHEPTKANNEIIEIDNDNISVEEDDDEIQIVQDFHPNKRVASVALSKKERRNKKQNSREQVQMETKEYQSSSQTSSNTSFSSLQSLRVEKVLQKNVRQHQKSMQEVFLGILMKAVSLRLKIPVFLFLPKR